MVQKDFSVLLVDDDHTTNMILAKMIHDSGKVHEVICAKSGAEALEILRSRMSSGIGLPSLTLLDIKMPQMSGWEFLSQYVEEFSKEERNRLVLLTGSSDTKDLIKSAVHPHVDDYINKPIMRVEVDRILELYLIDEHSE